MSLDHGPGRSPFLEALLAGDRQRAFAAVDGLRADGWDVPRVYLDLFQPTLHEIGRLWEENRITVAHEHLATALIQTAMARLYGHFFQAPQPGSPVLVAACAEGERHEIGLRMVADLLELDGWDTHFLGASLPSGALGAMVREKRPDLVALSASLPTHVPRLAAMIEVVREASPGVRVAVGGRPFREDPSLAAGLGADLSARDARELLERLTAELPGAREGSDAPRRPEGPSP